MKQVEVKILQQSYLLTCQDGQEQRLSQAVRLVDEAMTRIHDAGKVRARERIAVLAALNLAYELGDLRQALEEQTELAAQAAAASADAYDADAAQQAAQQAAHNAAQLEHTEHALRALVQRLDDALGHGESAQDGYASDAGHTSDRHAFNGNAFDGSNTPAHGDDSDNGETARHGDGDSLGPIDF
ncbi:cell division protein ZapA [Allofranklinella schreckenbergeri]|uniref:Cell division protein ZapA n=1 Tax=Allofranklinella schreckenbergeri TaxID=1076744 RepID=A0A3M6QW81_9BURK|nr:cell division protein ZapA [Allofranklinella schreckenbergeri]